MSFVENPNHFTEESLGDTFEVQQRSYTPIRGAIGGGGGGATFQGNRSSRKSPRTKTPRVHEVEYTPAMDFLLRKVA